MANASNDWRKTPERVYKAVHQAEAGVAALQGIAGEVGLERKFTLDGRLVGDIGELLLCSDFRVIPDQKPVGHAHDLVGESFDGLVQIQVKLRRATRGGRIEFKYQPECLVLIECSEDWSKWRILYNGPGSIVAEHSVEVRPSDRRLFKKGDKCLIYSSKNVLQIAGQNISKSDLQLAPRTF
jgi:hypothetical protein